MNSPLQNLLESIQYEWSYKDLSHAAIAFSSLALTKALEAKQGGMGTGKENTSRAPCDLEHFSFFFEYAEFAVRSRVCALTSRSLPRRASVTTEHARLKSANG